MEKESKLNELLNWIAKLQPLLIVLSFCLGLFINYFINWQGTEKEFRKLYWDKHLNVYFEIINFSSIIINSDNPYNQEDAFKNFLICYYGKLSLIEDTEVLNATKRFKDLITANDTTLININDTSEDRLNSELQKMIRTYRESIYKYWNIGLINTPELKLQINK